jgi:hypothetical protein
MKALPLKARKGGYDECKPEEATHVRLNVPGPYATRILPVKYKQTHDKHPWWEWNGDTEKPTLRPSILTDMGKESPRCHSFVTDGKIKFLGDCGHELKGQTVDLLEVD